VADTAISAGPCAGRMEGRGGAASPVVVSVGGSVLLRGEDDARYLGALADLLARVARTTPLVVTTGGGRTAREYIRLGRELGLTPVELDELGIDVTRLHARLLAGRIGLPTPSQPAATVREAVEALRHGSPVVLGGTEPGHTTDAVAALVAVRVRAARLVNATDVDGIYSADPKLDPGARRQATLAWPELLAMLHGRGPESPGQNLPFDRLGAELLAGASIPLAVVDGRALEELEKALRGAPFRGTVVGGGGAPS
jgi:uridylate kinase